MGFLKKYGGIKIFALSVFLILSIGASAQTPGISGILVDSANFRTINDASVYLINAKDSILIQDTRTDHKGFFKFQQVPKGEYLLCITYPKFLDFVEQVKIDTVTQHIDIGNINLTLKSILLEDVTITGRKTFIRFRGDTIEYDAAAIKLHQNASVEELFKQLPGIQVDKDGNIMSQGKNIPKILVDGEEFFSDDPTLVTRNLRANMVDKVQLYDKSSDQDAFTKINKDQKVKTINLKLKDEMKKGYFGTINLGYGTKDFFENQAMINAFKSKRKFAAYLIYSNTGKTGLDSKGIGSYSEGYQNPLSNDLDNWDGKYTGAGLPRSINGGVHYDNKWGADRHGLSLNYRGGEIEVREQDNILSQNNLPQKVFNNSSQYNAVHKLDRQGLSLEYTLKADSTSEFKINTAGSVLGRTAKEVQRTSIENGSIPVSNSTRNTDVDSRNSGFNGNILWQKKLKKDRRTFSLNVNLNSSSTLSDGTFYTDTQFGGDTGNQPATQVVDQFKRTNSDLFYAALKGTYTEPITKYSALIANYEISRNSAYSELLTFENLNGLQGILDSTYSNAYEFNQFSNRAGLDFIFNKKKFRFQTGADIAVNKFTQDNLYTRSVLRRSFLNWFPNAQISYQVSSLSTLGMQFSGFTNQPTIGQLQPIVNNNDPLNILVGNSNLNPTFSNSFRLNYDSYSIVNSSMLNLSLNYNFTNNPIVSTVNTNSLAVNTYSFVNMEGHTNRDYSVYLSYSGKMKFMDLGFGIMGSVDGGKYYSLSNDEQNAVNYNLYKVELILSKAEKWCNLGVAFGPNYNHSTGSIQATLNNSAWGLNISPNFDFYLPAGFQLHADAKYFWQQKNNIFRNNFSRVILNSWISNEVSKKKGIVIRLAANDILDQNLGFSRNINNNMITEKRSLTISRYFLISAVWNFKNKNDEK